MFMWHLVLRCKPVTRWMTPLLSNMICCADFVSEIKSNRWEIFSCFSIEQWKTGNYPVVHRCCWSGWYQAPRGDCWEFGVSWFLRTPPVPRRACSPATPVSTTQGFLIPEEGMEILVTWRKWNHNVICHAKGFRRQHRYGDTKRDCYPSKSRPDFACLPVQKESASPQGFSHRWRGMKILTRDQKQTGPFYALYWVSG